MKRFFIFLLLFLVISCRTDGNLTITTEKVTLEKCSQCPNVSIVIPKIKGSSKIASSINKTIENHVINALTFGENSKVSTYQEAVTQFNNEYLELKKQFPQDLIEYQAKITGNNFFENTILLSVKIDTYLYTGGAHGYNHIEYLNFDKHTGKQFENWELFKNIDDFTAFAEKKFRIQEHIPTNQPINSTGFMFDNDVFELSKTIGFTKEGLQLIYNQYEIASYAEGQKILLLPYNEITSFLNFSLE